MSTLIRLTLLASIMFLAACGSQETPAVCSTKAQQGTRAIIQRHGQELVAEVTKVDGCLATTEFHWQDELIAARDYYRGLYPVSGTEYGYQFELDFKDKVIDKLFPMAVGNEIAFDGNLKILNEGTALDVWVHMEVVKETSIKLPGGDHKVFVVDINTEYRRGDNVKRSNTMVYYAPELEMVLKSVTHEEGEQSYWRVMKIEQPGTEREDSRQRRRSGTVMI